MPIDTNDAVNIPKGPTGPRTEAGKSKSSRNSIRTGLYAARDFIREGEEEEYAQTLIKLMDELSAEGTMEQTFATEIMGATWRLRRCRLVEEAFSSIDDLNFDPMMDERTEKQQRSVDRARAQSHLILRRSLVELQKLQTARFLNAQLAGEVEPAPAPAPANPLGNLDALMAIADKQLARQYREQGLNSFCNPASGGLIVTEAAAQPHDRGQSSCNVGQPSSAIEVPFCKPGQKPAPQTPRNAQCPCGSGKKYKRCCVNPAQQAINRAA